MTEEQFQLALSLVAQQRNTAADTIVNLQMQIMALQKENAALKEQIEKAVAKEATA